jgi:hypothetical protein
MGLALFIALEAGIFAPQAINAATDSQLTVNPDTGLAISGFDPVSYFTDGKAMFGRLHGWQGDVRAASRMARRCSGGRNLN